MDNIKIIASGDIGHDKVNVTVLLNNKWIEDHTTHYTKYSALVDKLFNQYMVDYNVTVEDYCYKAPEAQPQPAARL